MSLILAFPKWDPAAILKQKDWGTVGGKEMKSRLSPPTLATQVSPTAPMAYHCSQFLPASENKTRGIVRIQELEKILLFQRSKKE